MAMIRKMAGALALLVATLGISADARPLKPAQEARIKPAGKPIDCVQIRAIQSSRVRDDRTIDFYMAGGKVYRNHLPHRCPGLGFEEKFAYSTSLPQLCSVDTITVLHGSPGTNGPTCGLGNFQPITGAPR
jgi:hypothetical protein